MALEVLSPQGDIFGIPAESPYVSLGVLRFMVMSWAGKILETSLKQSEIKVYPKIYIISVYIYIYNVTKRL